jgi:hypothetical protein
MSHGSTTGDPYTSGAQARVVSTPAPDSTTVSDPSTRPCVYVRLGLAGLGDLAAVAYIGRLSPGRYLGL